MILNRFKNIPYKESPYIYFNENPPLKLLIDNFEIFKKEFKILATYHKLADENGNLYLDPGNIGVDKTNQHGKMYKGLYKAINLFARDTLLDDIEKKNGNWKPDEKVRIRTSFTKFAPKHFEFILRYKDIIGAVTYNISYPGSVLTHHYGLDSNYIRLHICVIESKDCIFDIEGWKYEWKEGDIIGFDDYYSFHGTKHDKNSENPRAILMVDMLKTYLKPYAKNWPIRQGKRLERNTITQISKWKGWDNWNDLTVG